MDNVDLGELVGEGFRVSGEVPLEDDSLALAALRDRIRTRSDQIDEEINRPPVDRGGDYPVDSDGGTLAVDGLSRVTDVDRPTSDVIDSL